MGNDKALVPLLELSTLDPSCLPFPQSPHFPAVRPEIVGAGSGMMMIELVLPLWPVGSIGAGVSTA